VKDLCATISNGVDQWSLILLEVETYFYDLKGFGGYHQYVDITALSPLTPQDQELVYIYVENTKNIKRSSSFHCAIYDNFSITLLRI